MHAPKEVIASHHLDWRPLVLESHMNGRVRSKAVKVNGVGASAQLPAGVVHIGVDVTPSSLVNFDAEQVATSLTSEAEARLLLERQFVLLAQRWWDEYAAIRPSHRRRLVKLFASDENATRKPVCVCLQRVKPGRALETPREAARFVSLLPYQRREMSGGLDTGAAVRWEQWSSTHAFLCAGQGDVEDHALLLVGLLLEFGLNAFICLGTKQCEEEGDDDEQFTGESAYAWAMVPADDGIIWFWDPITGKQHQHWRVHDHQRFGEQPNHPFVTVDCVFNETLFAANAQPSNHVQDCSFDLSNESDWKRLSSDVVLDLRQHHAASQPITLQSIPLDVHAASEMLEREFRALIKEEFKAAIKHMIPTGHSFKGFPFEMRTLNAGEALRECMSSFVGQDILDAHGDQVWHAVRCRVYTYPENVIVVWMMLACRYLTVST
ncbi:hypothetical protein PTSG_09340 [Salpingoeca rosetta]|uniref:CEP76 C2 domain-containing protein n=1 Tax=Salpingoeca rosetta (strain ATCC 50818 / BSB-021) TaxID=946362 RepID=F2UMC7_SALR5|nr:uncharacterized protein PTSG_09340 [Salpingoeca rosetta]EGD78276.1 hypothetical protein PTSG_09340 [Salpingoeca rosetta]|eukprot:XP_004989599.1 hypothetical protein PTSG_09340 [Salpingoeca rosetta]